MKKPPDIQTVPASTEPVADRIHFFNKFASKKALLIIGAVVVVMATGGGVLAAVRHNSTVRSAKSNTVIATVKKQTPLQLSISAPADNSTTLDSEAAVTGSTTAESTVTVNGVSATLSGNEFIAVIALKNGANTINVVATGKDGGNMSKTLVVTRNQPAPAAPSITLTGNTVGDTSGSGAKVKVTLNWDSSNIDASQEYYILRSTSPQPVLTGSAHATNTDGDQSFSESVPLDGTVYYYRVCQVTAANKCGTYSNQLPITAQVASNNETISIYVANIAGTTTVYWSLNDGTHGAGGHYLLWSPDPLPTYPSTGTVYSNLVTNLAADQSKIDHDFISGNTYYVRVCENLGGICGSYSNQATVTAP